MTRSCEFDETVALPAGRRQTVGIAYRGDPRAPGTWSGTPYALCRSFATMGVGVQPINAELPVAMRFGARCLGTNFHSDWLPERPSVRLQSMKAQWVIRKTGRLDGLVQMGYDYELPIIDALVTYDDMTIQQGFALGDPWFVRPPSTMRAWFNRQRIAFERAVACCVGSRWAADAVVREGMAAGDKVRIVGFGHNLEPRPVDRDWHSPRFVFIGREWERKNGPALVEAFIRLRRAFPDARLDLVGGHPRLGVEGVFEHGLLRLSILEHRRQVERLLEQATCFVMPSRYEPFGIAYVEAAVAGVPSIGTTIGGAAQIIGDSGWLVDPGDSAELFAAMREAADGATAKAMGARALQRARLFTWSAVVGRVADALGLLSGREHVPDLEET